jgi:hypothetical protein
MSHVGWASRRYGTSKGKVVAHLLNVYRTTGCRPYEAHHDGLSDPAMPAGRMAGTIAKSGLLALQLRINPSSHRVLAMDKAVFYLLCRGLGLPVPKLYGVIDPGCRNPEGDVLGEEVSVRGLLQRVDGDIIVKPARGVYGHGINAYSRTPVGFLDRRSGEMLTVEALAGSLGANRTDRLIVQERLRNHPELTELSGSETLQTVRIRCLVTSTGDVSMGGSFLKLAVGDQVVDNIDGGRTGNFLAAVRLETGRLCMPVAHSTGGIGVDAVERHPRTGRFLPQFEVPLWSEAKALAKRASLAFLPLRTVGWDIGLTPEGAVLVEGNPYWDPANLMAAPPTDACYAEEMVALLTLLRREARDAQP